MDQDQAFKIVLHPVFVHFPIAFYFLELVLLVLWVRKGEQEYRRFASFSFWIGYLFMLIAMAAGLFDAGGFSGIRGSVKQHVTAALIVFTLYSFRALFYWLTRREPEKYRALKLAGALLGNLAVSYAGFLGGLLVYQ